MNIVVNGGTRGIGKETAIRLVSEGNKIIVTGRNRNALAELSSKYSEIKTLVTDLSDFGKHSEEYFNFVSAEFDKVDILINTAGFLVTGRFTDISDDNARKIMETNFFGPASATRILLPLMKNGSHIVNISSMGGFQGSSKYAGLAYYSASKAAIACLTECLAEELKESGIRVNCLALGSVQTEMLDEAFPGYKAPVSASEMGEFIADFALKGHKVFNGKILPVAVTNP